MGKSERLQEMMIYLNGKKTFNLKDIKEKFSISRSTAIRDIASLENIGMPIYSQPGRNGYYGILPNRLLSPIVFTIDEMYALYFAMLTLDAYQTTAFHFYMNNMKEKFESCLSSERIETLRRMERVFCLPSIYHPNQSMFLKDIVYFAIEEQVCTINYQKEEKEQVFIVQFFDITSSFGQWYATGYVFTNNKIKVFRCDKILSIQPNDEYASKPLNTFQKSSEELFKQDNHTDFKVFISEKGRDLFYKEHYPSMRLIEQDKKIAICGFYNTGEENFIADYFIRYGDFILSIQPLELKQKILERLSYLHSKVLHC